MMNKTGRQVWRWGGNFRPERDLTAQNGAQLAFFAPKDCYTYSGKVVAFGLEPFCARCIGCNGGDAA